MQNSETKSYNNGDLDWRQIETLEVAQLRLYIDCRDLDFQILNEDEILFQELGKTQEDKTNGDNNEDIESTEITPDNEDEFNCIRNRNVLMRTTKTVHPYHKKDAWCGSVEKRTQTGLKDIKWLLYEIVILGYLI